MKRHNLLLANVLALALAFSFAGAAWSADGPATRNGPATQYNDKPLKGQIVSVNSDGTSIVINSGKQSKPKQVTVTCDAKTVVWLDGAAAKVTDLTAGDFVSIEPATGTAEEIHAKTPPKK